MQLRRSLLVAGLSMLVTASCGVFGVGGKSAVKVATPSVATSEPIKVVIETNSRSNGCAALHVLVRAVKRTDYPRMEYEEAARFLRDGVDDKTLEWLVLMPGEECEREIMRPLGSDIALFFMFASPSEHWKWLVTSERKDLVRCEVEDNRACVTSPNSERPRSQDVASRFGLERKRCRSYAE